MSKPRPWTAAPAGERDRVRVELATNALEQARGSITEAAKLLDVDRADLAKFVKKHGLSDFARELRMRLRGHDRGRQWESEKK